MSYKTSLLKETKELIEKTKNEIKELAEVNKTIIDMVEKEIANGNIGARFYLNRVEENLQTIELKEAVIKVYKNDLEEILKMKDVA